ncbi:MAG: PEP-CTERM sorting domain-containing protein [Coleofasciculus sp.]|uniref:PEP-CTERM sorting domain-containing protein n=1 Tax=Coleofasciculus sp. TaxID=3100458 RepID=UPI003A2BF4B1
MKLISATDKITCNFRPKLQRFGLALSATMFVGIGLLFTSIPALSATLTGVYRFDFIHDDNVENVRVNFNLNFNDEGLFLLEGSTIMIEEGTQRNVINAVLDENGNLQSLSTDFDNINFRTGEVIRTSNGVTRVVGRGATIVPEPLTILGSATALGFGALLKRESSKKKKS